MNPQPYRMSKVVEAKFSEAVKALVEEAKNGKPEFMGLCLDLHVEVVPEAGAGVMSARVVLVSDPKRQAPADPGIPDEVDQLIRSSQATLKNRRRPPADPPTED